MVETDTETQETVIPQRFLQLLADMRRKVNFSSDCLGQSKLFLRLLILQITSKENHNNFYIKSQEDGFFG